MTSGRRPICSTSCTRKREFLFVLQRRGEFFSARLRDGQTATDASTRTRFVCSAASLYAVYISRSLFVAFSSPPLRFICLIHTQTQTDVLSLSLCLSLSLSLSLSLPLSLSLSLSAVLTLSRYPYRKLSVCTPISLPSPSFSFQVTVALVLEESEPTDATGGVPPTAAASGAKAAFSPSSMSDDAKLHWRWQQRRVQQLRGRMRRRMCGIKAEEEEEDGEGATGEGVKEETPNATVSIQSGMHYNEYTSIFIYADSLFGYTCFICVYNLDMFI